MKAPECFEIEKRLIEELDIPVMHDDQHGTAIISGAALAVAAILLIIPGFATDFLGLIMIFPPTRKLLFGKISKNYSKRKNYNDKIIEGESEDLDDKK